jgi:hypothetical protein
MAHKSDTIDGARAAQKAVLAYLLNNLGGLTDLLFMLEEILEENPEGRANEIQRIRNILNKGM